tara:strand:+ start:8687 stop:10081 length:1395 start_codon:yes stop_codon:yes gene_type:complete
LCGIIGIISKEDIAHRLYYGLNSLQHRGQDSSGILVLNKESMFLKKKCRLVKDLLRKSDFPKMKGNIGIGHTRYPTAGCSPTDDAHPFIINYKPLIGIAHNGNLTNYNDLKARLKKKGVFFHSTSDAEAILNIFATKFENSGDIFEAFKGLVEEINGSYSVVMAIQGHGLIAFRDPNGFRPLILGKDKSSYIFASESVALDVLGFNIVGELKPGELIYIDENLKTKSEVIKTRCHTHCMFEWVYFARPDSIIEDKSVYEARLNLGRELAKTWKNKNIDVVIPVPDTSRTAGLTFAESLGLKYREGLIKNRYVGRTFIMPSQKERDGAVKMKLNPILHEIKGERIALIDDSIVRGTTSKNIVKLVKDAGAKEVHLISTCPPIKYPCFYGIDMPTREELIAANASVEEITKIINADSLTYQSLEGLKNAIGLPDMCTACLTGEYPTKIANQSVLSEYRKNERSDSE